MPEVQEVFHMATQKVRPDPDALERQHRDQRRHVAKQKVGVLALVAAVAVAGGVFAISTMRGGNDVTGIPGADPTPSATNIPSVTGGALEPGTYVVKTLDPDFDASYRVTIDVPDGYEGSDEGFAVLRLGRTGQMAVSAWVIGDVYGDPCRWSSTLLDRSSVSSVDALAAALASQRGLRVSTQTDVTVDGFVGKYMERTVLAGTDLDECNGAQFRPWLGTDGGTRFLDPGQRDLLWIVDVDGVPLVIDASLGGAGTSPQAQAEHIQIAESTRIDPR
jgi:hypothetical protein